MSLQSVDSVGLAQGQPGRARWLNVVVVALILSVFNIAKPPVVDDGYYFLNALQVAAHPGDPYGFNSFSTYWATSAIELGAPPVVAYWLGLGVALFGKSWILLKIWMMPWAFVFVLALDGLLRRWSPRIALPMLWLASLSPVIMPGINFAPDIPMYALVLSSVLVMVIESERGSIALAIASGLLAGLALETKYNGATVIPALLLYTLLRGRIGRGLIATTMAMMVFVAWESFMVHRYGQSIFMIRMQESDMALAARGLLAPLNRASSLLMIGSTCIINGLLVWRLTKVDRRWGWALEIFVVLAFVAALGFRFYPAIVYGLLGCITLVSIVSLLIWAGRESWNSYFKERDWTRSSTALFLLGWLITEIVACIVLSPFSAARRFVGPMCVVVLVGAFLGDRLIQAGEKLHGLWRLVVLGTMLSILYCLSDMGHAYAVESAFAQAAAKARSINSGGRIWSTALMSGLSANHEYGIEELEPDVSMVEPGDWVLIPVQGLQGLSLRILSEQVRDEGEIIGDNAWPISSIPDYYGGALSLLRRDTPWVVLVMARVQRRDVLEADESTNLVEAWVRRSRRPLPAGAARAVFQVFFRSDSAQQERMTALFSISPDFLLNALHLADPRVRALSVRLLVDSASTRADVLPRIQEVAEHDPDPRVRAVANSTLARLHATNSSPR